MNLFFKYISFLLIYKFTIIKIYCRKVYEAVCNCYDENTVEKKWELNKWLSNSKFKVNAKV